MRGLFRMYVLSSATKELKKVGKKLIVPKIRRVRKI